MSETSTAVARKRHIRVTIDIEQELTPAQEQAIMDQLEHGMDAYGRPLANIPVYDEDGNEVSRFDLGPFGTDGLSSWDVENIDIADDHLTKVDEILFDIDFGRPRE